MKKNIAVIVIILLCMASTTSAFARGKNYGNHGGYHGGYNKPYYHGYRGGGHHDNDLGIAIGVAGGLLLGSALIYSATTPQPKTVVYGPPPHVVYQPEVVVLPPKICMQDQIVNGEWQTSSHDGRQFWVSFPYPVTKRVQVPCY